MFANANEEVRSLEIRSRGLRAPAARHPLGVFHGFYKKKVGTIIIGLYLCK